MDRCKMCPDRHNFVPGDGPLQLGGILFLGEGPGEQENSKGRPFQGRTGQEVNQGYLPLIGMPREICRFDNTMHCMPDTKLVLSKPKDRALAECCAEAHLYPWLESYKPKLIVAMGAFACHVLDPTIDLDLHHGFVRSTPWGKVFVMYHPAQGLYEPKRMLHIRTDWTRLGRYLKGKLHIPVDEFKGVEDYAVIEDPHELKEDLANSTDLPLACDTESTRTGAPFCLTYSVLPGRARLIRAPSVAVLGDLQLFLNRWKGPILWHNWLYDSTVVKKMGLRFNPRLIRDTMVWAFHLGNLPQGLKALAWRELGMEMEDFDDLVTPYARPRVLQYYMDAYAEDWEAPEPFLYRGDDGKYKLKKPQSMTTKLKRFFTDLGKNPDKDVFETWHTNWEESQEMIEARMGPWPGKCISYAWEEDRERTVRYACRDSDALLRLWPVMQHMRSRVCKTTQERWRD